MNNNSIYRNAAGAAGRAALEATATELRAARKQAEEENLAMSRVLRERIMERGNVARAAVANGLTRAQETWIGTRWYARSHPRIVRTVAIAAGIVFASAVALALTRED